MVGCSQNKVVLDRALDGTQVRGIRSAFRARRAQRQALRSRRLAVTTSASASSSGGLAEEDGTQQGGGLDDQNLTVPTTCMAQLSGSGGATMQKSKLNLTQEVRISQPKTDDENNEEDLPSGPVFARASQQIDARFQEKVNPQTTLSFQHRAQCVSGVVGAFSATLRNRTRSTTPVMA